MNTSGGFSLSNIATEVMKFKKAGVSIVGVPFELTLTPQESLAYGIYYSIDLRRTDVKPQLTTSIPNSLEAPELVNSKIEMNHNIMCQYNLVKKSDESVDSKKLNNETLKKAV